MDIRLKEDIWALIESFHYGFRYSMLDLKGENSLHQPVNCKDYITDIFWSENQRKDIEIYGFKWFPGILDISAQRFWIALTLSKEKLGLRHASMAEFLNFFEAQRGIPPSLTFSANDGDILAVNFDREWTVKPVIVSIFTSLLRVGSAYDHGNPIEYFAALNIGSSPPHIFPDLSRRDTVLPKIMKFLAGAHIKQEFSSFIGANDIHLSGIFNTQI